MKPNSDLPEDMMNHSPRAMWRSRLGWPSAVRAAAVITATASLALLVPACSGPSSTGPGGSPDPGESSGSSLLAFAQCMRSKGIPNFPDPQASGGDKFPGAQQLGVSDSQYQAAETACQNLLPAGIDDQLPAAEVQQLLVGMWAFSQCMRSRGVPNWPDPSVSSSGQPEFQVSAHGMTRAQAHSPQVVAAENKCSPMLPSALGGVPVG